MMSECNEAQDSLQLYFEEITKKYFHSLLRGNRIEKKVSTVPSYGEKTCSSFSEL